MLLVKGHDGRVWHTGATPHHRAPCGMTMKDPVTFRDADLIDSTALCQRRACIDLRRELRDANPRNDG